MPLPTHAEVIAAIALFTVLALALAWVGLRRIRPAHERKPETAPLRRRAF
jgi:hypothetical protein